MKKLVLTLLTAVAVMSSYAAAPKVIKLDAPNLGREAKLMKAFEDRSSSRSISDKELSMADLSDLLWAANGINRPDKGMRTAASALNKQDIDIYVIMKDGSYIYDAEKHALNLVAEGDHRPLVVAGQQFVAEVPVCLVLVSELGRFDNPEDPMTRMMGAMDCGIVSANISLFCSGAGLATVPRASMDGAGLKKAFSMTLTQVPMMNHPVGYNK